MVCIAAFALFAATYSQLRRSYRRAHHELFGCGCFQRCEYQAVPLPISAYLFVSAYDENMRSTSYEAQPLRRNSLRTIEEPAEASSYSHTTYLLAHE